MLHRLDLVSSKNHFDLPKIFLLSVFRMVGNQIELQASTEVYHQFFGGWEVQTMWNLHKNVDREACLNQKMFTNGLNMNLPQGSWIKTTLVK